MRKFPMIIGAFILLSQLSCNTEKHEKRVETKYLVTSPIKKDTVIIKDYVCQIHSIRNIEVRALEKGYLQEISVDEGQFVKRVNKCSTLCPISMRQNFKRLRRRQR